jgi:ABC-type sugar transport system substrate-binding protein
MEEIVMKKIIALLLAFLMVFSLVACSSNTNDDDKTTDDASTTASSDNGSEEGTPSADGEREPYELVYMCNTFGNVWCKNTETAMKSLEDEYNFKLLSTDTDYDMDLWMTNIETYCDQGVDGFLCSTDETMTERTYEVTSAYGIPFLSCDTAIRDSEGKLLTSGVELNAYQVGCDTASWIVDNYKEHFGIDSFDGKKVGYISIHYSSFLSFENRCAGAEDTILAAFPDVQLFTPDLLAQGGMTADCAYNEVSPILASNPDIDYWLITAVIDDWGLGAARAVESVGLESKTLITSAGGESLVLEWDNGYDADGTGCWKACCYYEAMDYVELLIPGIISILDGETTMEHIWDEWDEEGSEYASYLVGGTLVTKDTYLDHIKMRY